MSDVLSDARWLLSQAEPGTTVKAYQVRAVVRSLMDEVVESRHAWAAGMDYGFDTGYAQGHRDGFEGVEEHGQHAYDLGHEQGKYDENERCGEARQVVIETADALGVDLVSDVYGLWSPDNMAQVTARAQAFVVRLDQWIGVAASHQRRIRDLEEEVEFAYSAGRDDALAEGQAASYDEGHDDGYEEGYEEGREDAKANAKGDTFTFHSDGIDPSLINLLYGRVVVNV